MSIAANDPGRDKCGLAVLAEDGTVLAQTVVATVWLAEEIVAVVERFAPKLLLLGNGTTSKSALETIKDVLPDLKVKLVDEYRTTEMARDAYWEANPPRGWRKWFPLSMQLPPVPVDDFVAVILAKRYLMNLEFSNRGWGD